MSAKDNEIKVNDSLGTNHLTVCCDAGQLNLKLGFELVTPGHIHQAAANIFVIPPLE